MCVSPLPFITIVLVQAERIDVVQILHDVDTLLLFVQVADDVGYFWNVLFFGDGVWDLNVLGHTSVGNARACVVFELLLLGMQFALQRLSLGELRLLIGRGREDVQLALLGGAAMEGGQPNQCFGVDRHHLLPVSRGFFLLWLLPLWRVVGSVE